MDGPSSPSAAAAAAAAAKMTGSTGAPHPNDDGSAPDRFTLMHPAFQSGPHKRKFGADKGAIDRMELSRDEQHAFLANVMQSQAMDTKPDADARRLHAHGEYFQRALKMSAGRDDGDLSADSSGSEEIDPTSNGCIDFSNNNNSGGKGNL